MRHQLRSPQKQQIHEGDYAFCANKACHVVYFSEHHLIPKEKLRAFQPHCIAMLCYCFDISESAYRTALDDGTAAAIKGFVVQQTQAGLCACASRNPSGRCCLADFKRMEKEHDC